MVSNTKNDSTVLIVTKLDGSEEEITLNGTTPVVTDINMADVDKVRVKCVVKLKRGVIKADGLTISELQANTIYHRVDGLYYSREMVSLWPTENITSAEPVRWNGRLKI